MKREGRQEELQVGGLRLTESVARWLGAIAREAEREVYVLLLGSPGDATATAGFIARDQEASASSVRVRSLGRSVAEATKAHGNAVIGLAHLHPGSLGAFASSTDQENLIFLGKTMNKLLLQPRMTTTCVERAEGGELRLDPYGRKVVKVSAAGGTPGLAFEYRETHMTAVVFSLTFCRGEDPAGHPKLHGQALAFRYCCDPSCATPKAFLLDGVPVEIVRGESGFAWSVEEVRQQIKERVQPLSAFSSWQASRRGDECEASGASGAGKEKPRRRLAAPRSKAPVDDDYAYLRGDEDLAGLLAAASRFLLETGARLNEISAAWRVS